MTQAVTQAVTQAPSIPSGIVLLVAHDAGGAQILAHWQNEHQPKTLHVIDGPARQIFRQRNCQLTEVSLEEGLNKADWVLTGSSWGSAIEKLAIRGARINEKFCVTFLDHWVNYRARFEFKGEVVLPDEIWVGDADAFRLAAEKLPDALVVLQSNPYFKSLKETFRAAQLSTGQFASKRGTALWIGENVSGAATAMHQDPRHRGYTEAEALDFFLENLDSIDPELGLVRIRPHPSDSSNSYTRFLEAGGVDIEIVTNQVPLEEQILDAQLVVGADSVGLVIGVLASKRTISAIPPGGTRRSVPWNEIEDLNEIVRGVIAG